MPWAVSPASSSSVLLLFELQVVRPLYKLALGMMESRLHWATFIINIMASVALVYVYKLTPEKSTLQLFLATGICGGWSTFSTFSYETVRLIQQGREWEALAYVLSSVAVAFAAIWLLVK